MGKLIVQNVRSKKKGQFISSGTALPWVVKPVGDPSVKVISSIHGGLTLWCACWCVRVRELYLL